VFVELKNAVSGGTLLMSRFRFAAGTSSVSSSSLQKQHSETAILPGLEEPTVILLLGL